MDKKKILIATPIHTDNLLLQYVQSLFKIINDKSKYDINVFFRRGSLVNRCRNELIGYFLDSEYDYIFFIDSDIVNFTDQFYNIINAYFELEKKISKLMLGVSYPIKHFNFDYNVDNNKLHWEEGLLNYNINIREDNNSILKEADENNGFVKVQDIAGGFMMFSKKVLLEMINHYPESKYKAFNNDHKLPKDKLYNLFHSFVEKESRFYLSEDYGFCYLFRRMGGNIYVNIKLSLSHYGEQIFSGSLYNTIKLKNKQ